MEEETFDYKAFLTEETRKPANYVTFRPAGEKFKIEDVIQCFKQNAIKGEANMIDPHIIQFLNEKIDFNVFISGTDCFTREMLLEEYPFEVVGAIPEMVFDRIGIIRCLPCESAEEMYIIYDDEDPMEFRTPGEMLMKIKGMSLPRKAPPEVTFTQFYNGRETWNTFKLLHGIARGIRKMGLIEGGGFARTLTKMIEYDAEKTAKSETKKIEHDAESGAESGADNIEHVAERDAESGAKGDAKSNAKGNAKSNAKKTTAADRFDDE